MPSLMPIGKQQYTNNAGVPLAGGKVYTFDAGTTTPKATYSDAAGTIANPNPIVLNARGEALVFWDGAYAIKVTDANGALVYTVDNYQAPIMPGDLEADDGAAKIQGTWFNGEKARISKLGTSSGSALIGFLRKGAGSVARRLEDKLYDLPASLQDAGAAGTGDDDDGPALLKLIGDKHVSVPAGRYRFASKVDFQPNPATLQGSSSGSTILIADADTKTALRFGAVGADDRQVTTVSGLSFESEVEDGTAIDAQAVFPLFLDTMRFYKVGPHALKLFQIYYGRLQNVLLRDSGLDFVNVNNFSIDGGDISGMDDSTNYDATDWGSTLEDCDSVSFHNLTFETWKNSRAVRHIDCKNITYNGTWFEANTCDEPLRFEQTTATTFNDNFLELFPAPADAFIGVDNGNTIGTPRTLVSNFTIRGGHIRLDQDRLSVPPIVNAAVGSRAAVAVDGATICGGHLFGRGDVLFNARNITLSSATEVTDQVKTLYSTPNAVFGNNYNTWCVGSVQQDWDFSLGAGFTEVATTELTIGVGGADGEYMTGTKGVKIANIPSNGTWYVVQKVMSQMGPVVTEGQTHLIFVRFKPSADMSLIFSVEGFFIEYESSPVTTFVGGYWYDFVLKTSSDRTWAQGRQGDPKLHISVVNNSGAAANLYLDRVDYRTVQGDVYLP